MIERGGRCVGPVRGCGVRRCLGSKRLAPTPGSRTRPTSLRGFSAHLLRKQSAPTKRETRSGSNSNANAKDGDEALR